MIKCDDFWKVLSIASDNNKQMYVTVDFENLKDNAILQHTRYFNELHEIVDV